MTNIINPEAYACFSIRSSEQATEDKLKQEILATVDKFNEEYKDLATAKVTFEVHLPPFEKSDDDTIAKAGTEAAKNIGIKHCVATFHAGAETHIYANETNKNGEKFIPCLLGVADIYNMHSSEECIDIESFKQGYKFIKEIFNQFNK